MMTLTFVLMTQPTVHLAPPRPLRDAVSIRYQPGTTAPLRLVETLLRCAAMLKKSAPCSTPLQLRVVHQRWLDRQFGTVKSHHRRGRYYPSRGGHQSLIYLADGRDASISLAHEWIHHLASVYNEDWTEAYVEQQAQRCASGVLSPEPTSP